MSAITRRPVAELWKAAVGFLIEPIERPALSTRVLTDALVVAVIGMAPGCGTTTVARLLALALAERSEGSAAVVVSSERPGGWGWPGAGGRLARKLGGSASGRGRLAFLPPDGLRSAVDHSRGLAPVVAEVGYGANWAIAASLADLCVLVAGADADGALLTLVAGEVMAVGAAPLVVINRVESGAEADVLLPDAGLAARLVRAGVRPTGPLWGGATNLGDLCKVP